MIPSSNDFVLRKKKRQTTDDSSMMMIDNHNQQHRPMMMMNHNMLQQQQIHQNHPTSSSSGGTTPTTIPNPLNMNMNMNLNPMTMTMMMMNPRIEGGVSGRTPSPSGAASTSILSTSFATAGTDSQASWCSRGYGGGGIGLGIFQPSIRNEDNNNNIIGRTTTMVANSSFSSVFANPLTPLWTTTPGGGGGNSLSSGFVVQQQQHKLSSINKKAKLGHHPTTTSTNTTTSTTSSKKKKKASSSSNNNKIGGGGNKKKTSSSSPSTTSITTTTTTAGGGGGISTTTTTASSSSTSKAFENTDADIAKEMNALTVDERERVYDDIHGVAQPLQTETPHYLETQLKAFDIALNKIPKTKKKSLERAYFLNPRLSKNDKFKLMFLRADMFNTQKAVDRYITFFDCKKKLWGEHNLGKTITLEDLSEDDMGAVKSGFTLQLQETDTVSRPIIVFDVTKFNYYKHPNMLRFTWYMFMCAIQESDEAQRQGCVVVSYLPSKRKDNIIMSKCLEMLSQSDRAISKSLPLRVTGYHFCTDSQAMQFFLGLLRVGHSKNERLRLRAHFGSELEIQYSLLTYGISPQISILLFAGDGATELHTQYLEGRQQSEEEESKKKKKKQESINIDSTASKTSSTAVIIDYPSPKDALIGRGHPYHDFIGTRVLINQVDSQLGRYKEVIDDRFRKSCLNMEVVQNFKEYTGGRFLQRNANAGGWQIMDDNLAREKIGNLFRYRMKLAVEKQQKRKPLLKRQISSPSFNSYSGDDNDDNDGMRMMSGSGGGGSISASTDNDPSGNNKRRYHQS